MPPKYTKGEVPDKLLWDWLQDCWIKGATPNSGSLRVTLAGGAPPPAGEVAVKDIGGSPREPLHLDALNNLKVIMSGPGGVPTYIPVYGAAPNDYVQVLEVAPVTGQYYANPGVAPGPLGEGNAALALLDTLRRLKINIAEFSSTTPVNVNITGGAPGAVPIDVTAVAHVPGTYSYNPGGATNGAEITGIAMNFSSAVAKAVTIQFTDGVKTWVVDSVTGDSNTFIFWTPREGRLILPQSCSLEVVHTVNNMDVRILGSVL